VLPGGYPVRGISWRALTAWSAQGITNSKAEPKNFAVVRILHDEACAVKEARRARSRGQGSVSCSDSLPPPATSNACNCWSSTARPAEAARRANERGCCPGASQAEKYMRSVAPPAVRLRDKYTHAAEPVLVEREISRDLLQVPPGATAVSVRGCLVEKRWQDRPGKRWSAVPVVLADTGAYEQPRLDALPDDCSRKVAAVRWPLTGPRSGCV